MRRSMKYPAFVAFSIIAVGCSGDRSHSPSASALIQDANHLTATRSSSGSRRS